MLKKINKFNMFIVYVKKIKTKEPQGVRGKAVLLLQVKEETKEKALLSSILEMGCFLKNSMV